MDATVLVGRDRAITEILTACRQGPGLALTGPSGVGLTALLDAAASALRADGVAVHVAVGPDATAPLRAAEASGGVLVVDRLDTSAAFAPAVVAGVHRSVLGGGVRLLVTVGADADDGWWGSLLPRLAVGPLERPDADALAERLLGGPIDARSRERLWTFARGHPRALVTAVEAVRASGGWERDAGLWDLRGNLEGAVEAGVAQTVAGLPDDVRGVLEVLAVASSMPLDAAERLDDAPALLTEAERRGLVRVEERGDDALWCAPQSEMLAAALRSPLGPGAEATCWRKVGAVLGDGPGVALEVLRAQAVAGVVGDGPCTEAQLATLVAGAEAALTLSRWGLGAELASLAWTAGGGTDALAVLAQCLGARGDHHAIRRLSAALGERPDADAEHQAHAETIAVSQFHLGDAEGAFATLRRAREDAVGRDAAVLDLVESHLRSFAGDQERAAALARPWIADDDLDVRVEALTALGTDAVNRGCWSDAGARYGEALAAALAHSDTESAVSLAGTPFLFGLSARAEAGELDLAISQAEAVEPQLVGRDDPTAHGWLALHLARTHLRAGHPRAAVRWAGESVSDLRRVNRPGWVAHPLALQVAGHALAGELALAKEARTRCEALPPHAVAIFRGEELRFVAAAAALEGDAEELARLLAEAVDAARAGGALPYLAAALHDQVRLGRGAARRAAAEELVALGAGVDSPLVQAFAAQAGASIAGDVEGLAAAAAAYDDLGALLDAAECWAEVARAAPDDRTAAEARRRSAAAVDRAEPVVSPLLDPDQRPLLTGREAEIVDMLVAGASRQEIAGRLVVSVRTVDSHLQRIYRKLGVHGRRGLLEALGQDAVSPAP